MTAFSKIPQKIMNALSRHKFTLPQREIVHLILRLSYGCQREAAYIPKKAYFQQAGLFRQDIHRHLCALEEAAVLLWDRSRHLYQINEQIEAWKIPEHSFFDENTLKELIALQLSGSRVVSPQLTTSQNVSPQLTNDVSPQLTKSQGVSPQLTNAPENVSPQLTTGEVHNLQAHTQTPSAPTAEGDPKDIIIDIYKDKDIYKEAAKNTAYNNKSQDGKLNCFTFFDQNIKPLTEFYSQEVAYWIDEFGEELLLHVFKHALRSTKDQTASLTFINKILKRVREKEIRTVDEFIQAEKEREAQLNRPPKKPSAPEPEWLKGQEPPTETPETENPERESFEEKRRRMEAIQAKYKAQTKRKAAT